MGLYATPMCENSGVRLVISNIDTAISKHNSFGMLNASSSDKTAVFDTLGMKMSSHICFITSVLINKNTLNNLRNKSCRMSSDASDSIAIFPCFKHNKASF